MDKIYYIDESGNTGDAKITTDNFSNQPVFTLASVSIPVAANDRLEKKINELKNKYKIRISELKASKIYGKKDNFFYDLFFWLNEINAEFIVEIVDKRSYLISTIVEFFIIPPFLSGFNPDIMKIKGEISQLLYSVIADSILIDVHAYTISPSKDKLKKLFKDIKESLNKNLAEDGIKNALMCLDISMSEYFKLEKENPEDNDIYKYFLQESDYNKRDQPIAFLSHLPSFCNIYARINKVNNKQLNGITIIHDNQDHFNDLIVIYKNKMDSRPNDIELPVNDIVDFKFVEKATLIFGDSKEYIGIQVADCIAGFTMRFVKDLIENKDVSEVQWKSFCVLQKQYYKHASLGTFINCPDIIRQDIFYFCKYGITD